MAEHWQKWMPFHIDRFRGSPDVQAMTPTARLGYLYLLASAWQTDTCTIPTDAFDLASLSGLGDELWALHGPRILRKFTPLESGRLQNAALLVEWNKARGVFEARSNAAKKTTANRFLKRTESVSGTHGSGDRTVSERRASRSTDTMTGTETTIGTKANTETLALTANALPAAAPFVTMPLNDGSEFAISMERVCEWQGLYPAANIEQELRKYKGWADANPTRRKTRSGILRSVNAWLAKAHDSSTSNRNGGMDGANRGSHSPGQQRLARQLEELAKASVGCNPQPNQGRAG
jgi:hypothetical protein